LQKDFYLDLSDEVIAICEELLRRAKEWHLPIRRKENFVGFGKIHGFYMFWISRKDEGDYFKARSEYACERLQEIVHYPLIAENKDAILDAAQAIYREYLAHGSEFPRKSRIKTPDPLKGEGAQNSWHGVARHAVSEWRGATEERGQAASGTELLQTAQVFLRNADALLLLLSNEIRSARTKDVWKRYVLTDAETLEQISKDYSLTRERIRQLVKRGNREIADLFVRYCTYEKREIFDTYILPMAQALENASCDLPVFLQSAFADWGERKKKVVLQLLFGEENGAALVEACEKYQKKVTEPAKKQNGIAEKLARLQTMIRYPTAVYADTGEKIGTFVMEKEYTHISKFRKLLEKMQGYLHFVQNPNIVYYSTAKTDHRPSFLLEFENGRRVLVLVLPTLNMAFSYNLKRFWALRDFCKRRGYGYLIVDDREQALWDLECLPVDPALKSALDAILLSKGRILWDDIFEMKKTHDLTNSLIVAYVLQSKLHFVMDPYFCICSFT